jgi:tetratricopeptide (TPR) repeat protein
MISGHVPTIIAKRRSVLPRHPESVLPNLPSRLLPVAIVVALTFPAAAQSERPQSKGYRSSPTGNYLAGKLASSSRDMEAAATYLREALRSDPNNAELLARTFDVVLGSGDVNGSFPLAERVIRSDRYNRIARTALAVRSAKTGQFQAARQHLAFATRGPIGDLTAALMTSWSLAGEKNVKLAIDSLDKLQGPEWYAALKDLHAGLILDMTGRVKDAGVRLERAYQQDKNALRTVDAYARWLSRNESNEKAIELYREFAKSLPEHPLVEAAIEEMKTGKLMPLIRTLDAGIAEVLFGLGSALGRQGGEDYGLYYLTLALYLQPDHALALSSLGDLFEALKKPELAIQAFSRVPANSPLKRNAEIQRAFNLDALERTGEARELLEKLAQQYPKDLEVTIALGNLLRVRKDFAKAADIYSKAIEVVSSPTRQHWSYFYFRGISYERSKQWPKAEKDFEKALELFPDQPQVLNYLGYSWIDQGVNLDKGMVMIRRAVELRPNDGYIIDSLGWAHYRLGQFDDAVRELERAILLKPEDPTINDHLGDAYWRVGRRLEATFQWRHAVDLKPEPEDLPKIEEKLKTGLKDDAAPKAAMESKKDGG